MNAVADLSGFIVVNELTAILSPKVKVDSLNEMVETFICESLLFG